MIHVAAQGDSPYSLAYFLRNSTLSINKEDKSQSTPLHWACISHSHSAVKYLLAWKAKVATTDLAGYTPLHLALRDFEFDENKSLQTIRLLLCYNAPLDIRDKNFLLPTDYAKYYTNKANQVEVFDLINSCTSWSALVFSGHILRNNDSTTSRIRSKIMSYLISTTILVLMFMQVYNVFPHIGYDFYKILILLFTFTTLSTLLITKKSKPGHLINYSRDPNNILNLLRRCNPDRICPTCELVQ